MSRKIIGIAFLLLSIPSYSQSPTFQALLRLNHSVDNNEFNLKDKPSKEAFSKRDSKIWANVYFKYFKNPNFMNAKADECMKFSIVNQLLYNMYCTRDTALTVDVKKKLKDKVVKVDLVLYSLEDDKITSTKLKSKSYSLVKEDTNVRIQVAEGVVKPGAFLQLFIETESTDFNTLGPFNFMKATIGDYSFTLSTNIPECFNYLAPVGLTQVDTNEETIQLKEFTFATPPILDYSLPSYSALWNIPAADSAKEIAFKLQSIDFRRNVGTSAERLLDTSR